MSAYVECSKCHMHHRKPFAYTTGDARFYSIEDLLRYAIGIDTYKCDCGNDTLFTQDECIFTLADLMYESKIFGDTNE